MGVSGAMNTWRLSAFLLTGFLMLGGALSWRASMKMMGMSSSSAVSSSELRGAKPGDGMKLVMEIQQTDGRSLAKGNLLTRRDDTHYLRTTSAITANFDQNTKIVMGAGADVRNGAVVHITGKRVTEESVHAHQIRILTGYVQVR